MANTTFNGPVRSENGFQEWDGAAWVPVAGGGTTVHLINNGETLTLPTPTTAGETFILGRQIAIGELIVPSYLDVVVPAGATFTYDGSFVNSTTGAAANYGGSGPLQVSVEAALLLTFVFKGVYESIYGPQYLFDFTGCGTVGP